MRKFLGLLLVTLLPAGAGAQTTLAEYRRAVEAYSWQLRISRSLSEEARERMGLAWTGYLPRLSANGDFTYALRHRDGIKSWSFAVLPELVQVIYGGGAVQAAYRQSALGYDAALCDEEFSRLDVRYAADYAYWNLAALGEYLASRQEYVRIIRSLKEVVDWRFKEGYIAKSDVLMIDARLSEAEYQLITVEQNYAVALHNFNILRGYDGMHEETLAQSIWDSVPMPARMPFGQVLAARPDYAAAQLRTEASRIGVEAAKAPFNPQLSVGVGGAWQPLNPNYTGKTQLDGSLFVRVSVPIFHGGERRRAAGAARARYRQQEWSEAALHDAVLREELNGWTAVTESRTQIEATAESLRIAGENLEISTYSYNEGLVTVLDVLQAQLNWIQLYTNSITARYDYALAVAAYERITAR